MLNSLDLCGAVGADETRLILTGRSDAEIRALTARAFRARGLRPDRISRLLGVSKSQVYSDLIAAEAKHQAGAAPTDMLAN